MTMHYPGMNGFEFAVAFLDQSFNIIYNESYFRFELYQLNYTRSGISYNLGFSRLETKVWDNEYFNTNNLGAFSGSENIFCLKNNNYFLKGNSAASEYDLVAIRLIRWNTSDITNPSATWASDADIDYLLRFGRIVFIIQNKYVDFQDYNNVIKTYADSKYSFRLEPTFYKETSIYVKKNKVILADDLVQFGQTQELEFYNVEDFYTDMTAIQNNQVMTFLITLDENVNTYTRSVYSFFDLTGQVGGVFGFLFKIGEIFVGFFATKLFMFSLVSNLYQVQASEPGKEFSKIVPKTFRSTSVKKPIKRSKLAEESKTATVKDLLDVKPKTMTESQINTFIENQQK